MLRLVLATVSILALSACQTLAHSEGAILDMSNTQTREAVTSVLATAVNRTHIELGPVAGDTSVITVLPPRLGPYETHSTALPVRFDIIRRDGICFAVRHDTQAEYELRDVICAAKP